MCQHLGQLYFLYVGQFLLCRHNGYNVNTYITGVIFRRELYFCHKKKLTIRYFPLTIVHLSFSSEMFVIFHVEQNIRNIIWLTFPFTGTPERGTCIRTRKKVIATKFVFFIEVSIIYLSPDVCIAIFTRLSQFFLLKNHQPPAVNIIKLQSHKRKQLLAALINTLKENTFLTPPPPPLPPQTKNKRKNKTKLPPPPKKKIPVSMLYLT